MTSIDLTIGGLPIRVEGSERVCAALATRFGAFASSGEPAIVLAVAEQEPFQPELELASQATLTLDGERVLLRANGSGEFDLQTRRGQVRAAGLGAVDALLRAALSLTLPLDGALLLHGALVPCADGRAAWAYVGESGAGKSTVAHAWGGACDELVVARPAQAQLSSTPYWRGRRLEASARGLVCLRKDGTPSVRRLSGAGAVRALLRNLVRYVPHPAIDRAQLELAFAWCARVPVIEAVCPTGPSFLPFLSGELRRFDEVAA